MGANTRIEWAHHTFNPWIGCTKVSPACDHCYAERDMDTRFGRVTWGAGEKRHLTSDANWRKPRTWNRQAAKAGTRPRVFCASLADVFDAEVPDAWRDRLLALIALTPNLDWLLLTKRPQVAFKYLTSNVKEDPPGRMWANNNRLDAVYGYLAGHGSRPVRDGGFGLDGQDVSQVMNGLRWPLSNVWLGCTVETQQMAEARIPTLLRCPAAKRFLSCEPLLGPLDLQRLCVRMDGGQTLWNVLYPRVDRAAAGLEDDPLAAALLSEGVADGCADAPLKPRIDWIIAGGESGPEARPSHPDWVRSLRDQCAAAGVPFHFKQWGEYLPIDQNLPGFGKVHGATAVQPGRMKLHYGGTPTQAPKHAFAGRGVEFASMADDSLTFRVGKKAAGRLLDGREWNEVPG